MVKQSSLDWHSSLGDYRNTEKKSTRILCLHGNAQSICSGQACMHINLLSFLLLTIFFLRFWSLKVAELSMITIEQIRPAQRGLLWGILMFGGNYDDSFDALTQTKIEDQVTHKFKVEFVTSKKICWHENSHRGSHGARVIWKAWKNL